jgi:hypothetical protein
VTNIGTDRSQLAHVANEAKAALDVEKLDAVADRGYFNSEEILRPGRNRAGGLGERNKSRKERPAGSSP